MKLCTLFKVFVITALLVVGYSKEIYSQSAPIDESHKEIGNFITEAIVFLGMSHYRDSSCIRDMKDNDDIDIEYFQTQIEALSRSYVIYLLMNGSSDRLDGLKEQVQTLRIILNMLEDRFHSNCLREDGNFF